MSAGFFPHCYETANEVIAGRLACQFVVHEAFSPSHSGSSVSLSVTLQAPPCNLMPLEADDPLASCIPSPLDDISPVNPLFQDPHFARWLNDTEEPLTDLFPGDIAAAMDTSRAQRTDEPLFLASRAVSSSRPPPPTPPLHGQIFHCFLQRNMPGSLPADSPFEGGTPSSLEARGASMAPLPMASKPLDPAAVPTAAIQSTQPTTELPLTTTSPKH